MNAQTLLDSTPSQTFEFSTFWKSNSSQVNTNSHQEDDKFVARCRNNKYCQEELPKVSVPKQEALFSNLSLMPRTLNYSKLNKAREDLAWQKEMKQLGIKQI
jgi:hypothetical protein